MSEYPHTAISNWSGFVYQGYCAIHHCLRTINEFESIYDLVNYKLQLDSIEDFTIFDAGIVKTLHQCKAYKEQLYSKYTDAFKKLKDKALEYNEASFFLHTAKKISDKQVVDIHIEQDPVKLYQYSDTDFFCGVGQIEKEITKEIQNYQQKRFDKEKHRSEICFCQTIAARLIKLINEKVLSTHQRIHDADNLSQEEIAYREVVEFRQIIDILNDNYNSVSEEYTIWLYRKSFLNYISEYCEECKQNEIPWNNILNKYFDIIQGMSDDEFKTLMQKITPDKNLSFEDFEANYQDKPSGTEYKEGLFQILEKLNEAHKPIYWEANGTNYYPSTITSPIGKERGVSHSIIKNSNFIPFFSHIDNIITLHLDVKSIQRCVNNISDVSEHMDQVEDENRNPSSLISSPLDLALVSLDNEILNPIRDN